MGVPGSVRVHAHELAPGKVPLVIEPTDTIDLAAFLNAERPFVDEKLLEHGALLFRGFEGVDSPEGFALCSRSVCPELLDYVYGSTPRSTVGKGVYTATEYPASATIPQHNENAYALSWPMKLMFVSLLPARKGGETPLCDTLAVTRRIDPEIRATFRRRRVMYVRNYGHGVDVPWQKVFLTSSKDEVEGFCRAHSIEFEWGPGERLRTRQVCQGLATHPRTGQELWFNQAHLFHFSSLDLASRDALLSIFKEEDLPRNAYYGDGARIEEAVLAEIRAAFAAELVVFSWQKGDFLLVDNMLVSHGRKPFSGPRTTLVSMGEPFTPGP